MNWAKLTVAVRTILIALTIPPSLFAMELTVVPLVPTVITNIQLSDLNVGGSGVGTPLFRIGIDNSGGTEQQNVIVVYSVEIISGSSFSQLLYKGVTDPVTVPANSHFELLSSQFLDKNTPSQFHITNTIEPFPMAIFEQPVYSSGNVPSGEVRMSIYLAKGTALDHQRIGEVEKISLEIRNASQLVPISPGNSVADLSDQIAEISNPNPRFSWFSDLQSNTYRDCENCSDQSVYEIAIFERRPGASTADVLGSSPIVRERRTMPYLDYPFTAPQLVPGTVYVWQVSAFLKGIVNATIVSEPYAFRVTRIKNPDVEFVLNSVSSILSTSEYSSMWETIRNDYNSSAVTISNDLVLTREQLKTLESKFLGGKYRVITVQAE